MVSKINLEEIIIMDVNIEESKDEQDNKVVNFIVKDLDSIKVELSNSNVDDIKVLFDRTFDYIISKRKLITFNLKNTGNNLFIEVADDLIQHLNSEIEQSKDNFIKLIHIQDNQNTDF